MHWEREEFKGITDGKNKFQEKPGGKMKVSYHPQNFRILKMKKETMAGDRILPLSFLAPVPVAEGFLLWEDLS